MALQLTSPNSLDNIIVHKGDVFINGGKVYIAKLSGYPQKALKYRLGINYGAIDSTINGIPYTVYDMEDSYPFPILKTTPDNIKMMLDKANKADYSLPYNSYHNYYMETRLPLPKGLVYLDTSSNKYYVTTSACYLSTLLENIVELPVTTQYKGLGWKYKAEYKAGDLVIFDGYVYECVKDNTSEDTPVSETEHTYWTPYMEARATALDYVMPYQLLSLTKLISFQPNITFSSSFIQSYTVAGLNAVAEEKDIKNNVAGWLYNTIGCDGAHHGVAPYSPRTEDWKTTLGAVTYILPICIGGVDYTSPSHTPVDSSKNGCTLLSTYCPYLGSSIIIPEINYISTGTVDAYYAGEVYSDGTYVYYVTKTKVGSLSSCSLRVMNTSIINKDTMFFAPPSSWFSGKVKGDGQSPGHSIGLASDIVTNVKGTSYREKPQSCFNLAHDIKKYTYVTAARNAEDVHLPYANTTEKQKSLILTNYNYIVVNSVHTKLNYIVDGVVQSYKSASSMRDFRYPCEGRFVGDFTIDKITIHDEETKSAEDSLSALVDVYYVLEDDNTGNINSWLLNEKYTVWCFRLNPCTNEIISMNSDAESYVSKYGIKDSAHKVVDLKPRQISVTKLEGYDKLPDNIKEIIKDMTVPDSKSPIFTEKDVPQNLVPPKIPDEYEIKDPSTGVVVAKIIDNVIYPAIKKGDTKKTPDGGGDDGGDDGCVFSQSDVIWRAEEDGYLFEKMKKTKIAKYYNNIPVYFNKKYAEYSAPDPKNVVYLDDNRNVICIKNGESGVIIGKETANGETIAFYFDKIDLINSFTRIMKKGSYWIDGVNMHRAVRDFTLPVSIDSNIFTWAGREVAYAYSCSNVVNLPILSENEEVCGVKAGNKTIYDNGDGTGVIIDVVKPAPKGQLKLEEQIILGNIKLNKVEIKNTLENGVDVDYRENSIIVDDTKDEDVSTAEYAKGTLFYIEKSKTAYYATKDCTYEEIYKIYPIDYYVYKNNDECKLFHGIKHLVYKDAVRDESIRIYKRKSYAITEELEPNYYIEGNDVYKIIDDEKDRDKTRDKLVARFSNDKLVWLEDKDKKGKPDNDCGQRGIYDNDTIIWYDTEFTTLGVNTFYLYKNNIYRTLQNNVTEKNFGSLNYSGLYGQLYAQGKMLIWYCPPVTSFIVGTVFKYDTKIYVAIENISEENWESVDISKIPVVEIGFMEERTQDCETIYGDIVLYDTEYPSCYIFNVDEKVDITDDVLVDVDIFNKVSHETIVKIKNPSNIDTIKNHINNNTIVATKNIQDSDGIYKWLYHSFDSTSGYAKGTLFYKEETKTVYYATENCTYEEFYTIYNIDYYVYKNNIECKLKHGIKYLIYKDGSRQEKITVFKKKQYAIAEKLTPSYYVENNNIYRLVDDEEDREKTRDKLVARVDNDKLVWLEDKDKKGKPDTDCSPRGIYDNDTFVWYNTEFKTFKKGTYYLYKDYIYKVSADSVEEKDFGLPEYSAPYGQLYAQGNILIWYCPPVTTFIEGAVFKYSAKIYVATKNISEEDFKTSEVLKSIIMQIGVVEGHTNDCETIYGDIVLYDTEYPLCYIFNVGEKVDITEDILVDTKIFNAVSHETIVQVKNTANIEAIKNSLDSNIIIATKNILDNEGVYRWLFHSFDKTAELVNNYLYNNDEDVIYFAEDTCKIIKIYGYYAKLYEFICQISCPFSYGITHKIYRLKDGKKYTDEEYIVRRFIYYKEKYAKNDSYFLDGDYVYYKDKDGNNSKVARYVNGELISYSCYIDETHSETLFNKIGLYEKSLDLYFFYTTMVENIYSGVLFIDESEIYLAKTNVQNMQMLDLSLHKHVGTMIIQDNIPIFNNIYINAPTLYYRESDEKNNRDIIYRLVEKDKTELQSVVVGVYGVYRLNIIPYIKDYVIRLSEYPNNCCYKPYIGDVIYTGTNILNPEIGDKVYEVVGEVCTNNFTPQKEICYFMHIDCIGKSVWIFKYYADYKYFNKTFVDFEYKEKNVSNIMFYKCYTSEIGGKRYCTWQEVCSIVGCNRPLELTGDIPIKLPNQIGITGQRVWSKIFAGEIISLKGCEMNLRIWSIYSVELGNISDNKFHYNENYTYTWNYITKDFTIVDNTTGNTIYSKDNCEKISDLGIELDIISSCNFIFIVQNKVVESGLIKVTKVKEIMKAIPEKYGIGVNNTYRADRVRPYSKTDTDNPTNNIYHIIDNKVVGNIFKADINQTPSINIPNAPNGNNIDKVVNNIFNKYGETTYLISKKHIPNNMLYLPDAYIPLTAVDTKKKLKVTQLKLTTALSELSICLYQMLLSVDRVGETNNNRPVYEPWLVWGFYNLIYSKGTKAEDVPIIYPIFDLSPVYG